MDDPIQEIGEIVHTLCQAPPRQQEEALNTYFKEDAAFYHPFCRVDRYPGSRARLLAIFQWYKIMSPKIELDIESIAYDEIKQVLYVTIHQVFSIWFLLGLHRSSVILTTKLQLEKEGGKYYVASQNDLYQTDQFMKFVTIPWGVGGYIVIIWQWLATLGCVFLANIFASFTVGLQWYADGGRKKIQAVSNDVKRLENDAKDTGRRIASQVNDEAKTQLNGKHIKNK